MTFSVHNGVTFGEIATMCQEKLARIYKNEVFPSKVVGILVDGCVVDNDDTIETIDADECLFLTAVFEEDKGYFRRLEMMSREALIREIVRLRSQR